MQTNIANSEINSMQGIQVPGSYPLDTSRLLIGLMNFSKEAERKDQDVPISKELAGAISPNVLRILLSCLRFRDPATVNHTRRVAMLAIGIAEYLGWEYQEQKQLEIAGLLHDIGKIGVPDSILFKPGVLGPEELSLFALHHSVGVDLLQTCNVDPTVLNYIIQSHRDYDRPVSELSQGARILSVADAYDSLSSDHVYRDAREHHDVIKVLRDKSGIQFDSNVIDALCNWIEAEGIQFEKSSFRINKNTPPPLLNQEESNQINLLGHICSYLYLLENLYDGFFVVDSDLRFSVWNHGLELLHGQTIGDSLGKVWTSSHVEYFDQRENKVAEEDYPVNQVVRTKQTVNCILKIKRQSGRFNEIEIQAIPIIDSDGKFQGVAEIHRNLSETREQSAHVRELKIAASRDALTGAMNRGELESQLAKMLVNRSEKELQDVFSIIFLDVDHFKVVNDTFGHTVGDQVLIELTQLLDKETYSDEVIGRYGGEEFVLLCPETDIQSAFKKAERLRLAISNCKEGYLYKCEITSSFGVTESECGDSVESLFRRADKALYHSKENGRNKTTLNSTNLDLESEELTEDKCGNREPFVFRRTLQAFTVSDLLVYKLSGYINDHDVKVEKITKNEIELFVGRRGIFSSWGNSENRIPVTVTLKTQSVRDRRLKKSSYQSRIELEIRPVGVMNNQDLFNKRANKVFQAISSYLAADAIKDE